MTPDIEVFVPFTNSRVWRQSLPSSREYTYPRLTNDCYAWLADRQRLCCEISRPVWRINASNGDGQAFGFRDAKLAMLFKLTWGGR